MADPQSTKRLGIGLLAGVVAIAVGVRVCSQRDAQRRAVDASAPSASAVARSASDAAAGTSLGAPIAATHGANGDVLVAALDVGQRAVRVQRIDASGRVVRDRAVLDGVTWSNDADLKIAAHPTERIAVTWRGLRKEKLVRELVVLGQDLAPQGEPIAVAAASCTTRDAIWLSDGRFALSRPWDGAPSRVALPKDDDVSLLCASTRAYAVLEGEERTAMIPLGGEAKEPITVLHETEFGDDDQRELAEYTVGDEVGVVRVAASGAIAVREIVGGSARPLRKLKTLISKDDDVVAVDASEKVLVVVHTQDVSSSCPQNEKGMTVSTKVMVLRVDRETFEESTAELSPGRCGDEIGPFYTGAVGGRVSVAWTERRGGAGRARAPIVGLAHALVGGEGAPTFARIEQAADALVDAGCDANGCYAVALTPREEAGGGALRVLRYSGK